MTDTVKTVAISDIRPNAVALRAVDRESEAYIQLRDSISDPTIGLLNPINVRERSEEVDGQPVTFYEIIDGLHRYTACSEIGMEVIPVNVKDFNETEAFLAQIIGNAMKVETRPVEYTKHLQRVIAANPTWTMTDLANRVHRGLPWLTQRFGLLKLEPSIQKLVDDAKIPVSNAVVLAKLPHEEQLNYIEPAMTMVVAEFGPLVQARVNELKKAEREGRPATEDEFAPLARPRKKTELETELKSQTVLSGLVAGCDSKETAAYLSLAWVLQLDPASVASAKTKWQEKKDAMAEAKTKRAAERAQQKAKEAAEAAAKAQEEAAAAVARRSE